MWVGLSSRCRGALASMRCRQRLPRFPQYALRVSVDTRCMAVVGMRARIAAELRAEIRRQRLRRGDVAVASRLSAHTLRRRLNGAAPFPIEDLAAVCFAVGVPVSEMVARADSD
jgi:hypothetical protein